jgi:magnesium chelatase family protein
VEDGWVSIARAGCTVRYPACMQLVLAFNPCPCGNLGRHLQVCTCSLTEVHRYWRKVGGALLDRIDLRVPLVPVPAADMCAPPDPDEDRRAACNVQAAGVRQQERYAGLGFSWNARIPAAYIDRFCALNAEGRTTLLEAAEKLGTSSRAFHSILRMARTIADLAGDELIKPSHVVEAACLRRYGDGDFFWMRGRV